MELLIITAVIGIIVGIHLGARLEARNWRFKCKSGFRMASKGKLYVVVADGQIEEMIDRTISQAANICLDYAQTMDSKTTRQCSWKISQLKHRYHVHAGSIFFGTPPAGGSLPCGCKEH